MAAVRRANVLVLGGTGGVGEGIVAALLDRRDHDRVIVTSRDETKLRDLRERAAGDARLVTLHGGVGDPAAASTLLAAAEAHGPLRAVVASLGGWWEGGALTELDRTTWDRGLDALLSPHFVAARTFVPALDGDVATRYLAIGGGAARTPVPRSSLVSIAGAAQLMLTRALVAERRDRRYPVVEELVIDGPVKTNARHHGPRTDAEITAREAGDVVASMLRDGTTGDWPHVARDGPIVTMFARTP